jgi:hypothetical protein
MKKIWTKKETVLLLIFAVSLLIIIITITVMSFFPSQQKQLLPTPTITQYQSLSPTKPFEGESPAPIYDKTAQDILLEKTLNRKQLTTEDALAETKIVSKLPETKTSGVLYESQNITIDYTSGVNLFQVEILTNNIEQAKKEAVSWFLLQGMSLDGICNYPVQFYLSYDVLQSLRATSTVFSPLAPGCK